MSWKTEKNWSDKFLPEIKRHLGEYLIGEPPIAEDMERNTDLMVLHLDAIRIGCRVRRHKYLSRYAGEFTIRSGLKSGAKTELTKIIEGWGQYLFYGFCDEDEKRLSQWVLIDLNAFRLMLSRHMIVNGGRLPGIGKQNKDNSSNFMSFKITKDIVFAQSYFGD